LPGGGGEGGVRASYVHAENNFVSRQESLSYNANGASGHLEAINNRVMGNRSLSDNGNSDTGDGYAVLNNITVRGNDSFSHNAAGTYQNDVVLGDGSATTSKTASITTSSSAMDLATTLAPMLPTTSRWAYWRGERRQRQQHSVARMPPP
jgi:hypothetical protein